MAFAALSSAQSPDSFNPGANNAVYATAIQSDGRILVGGRFTTIGGAARPGLARLTAEGALEAGFKPLVTNGVPRSSAGIIGIAVQPDNRIVVVGEFSILNGQLCGGIGRLNLDGTLDASFNPPGTSGSISALALQPDGKILYAAIAGIVIGHSPPNCLGRLNADGSGDQTFVGSTSNKVYCLALQPDGKILVGGLLTSLSGQQCRGLGRLNPDGSFDRTFSASANGYINCLAVQPDGRILVGGSFNVLSGTPCSSLGRLNPDGTSATNFTPIASSIVNSIALQSDGKVLVGGYFTSLAGQPLNYLGRLNADGSLDPSFTNVVAQSANGGVYSLALQPDGNILVGGSFSTIAGQPRSDLARLVNTAPANDQLTFDGSTITWVRTNTGPELSSATFDGCANGNDWLSFGAGQRAPGGWELAALGLPPNATIRARGFAVGGYDVASSWFWDTVIGQPALTSEPVSRTNNPGTVATFSATAIGPAPLAFQWLKDGAAIQNGPYISGARTSTLTLNNVAWSDAAAYSVMVTNAFGIVTSQVARLVVPDPFISVQPASVADLPGQTACFSVTAGGTPPLCYQWRHDGLPLDGATSSALVLTNVQRSDAGAYDAVVTNVQGSIASSLALLSVNLAAADSFDPGANGSVNALAIQPDGKLLVGGSFTALGPQPRNYIARFNTDGTLDPSFNPDANGPVYALAVQSDRKLLVAGSFTTLGGSYCNYLGRLNSDGTSDTSFHDPSLDGPVYSIRILSDGRIVLAGAFTRLNASIVQGLGTTDANGWGWVTGPSGGGGTVYAMAAQPDGKLLIAVPQATKQPPATALKRLNPDGSLDASFSCTAGNYVYCLAVQPDAKILVGGSFTSLGGQSRGYIGRFNSNGTLDSAFAGTANNSVYSIALQTDGNILLGGSFTNLDGQPRNHIGRLAPDGSLDPIFNPGADGPVNSLALRADGAVLVGGVFSILSGQPRQCLAELEYTDPATQALTFDGAEIDWGRGGSGPELINVTFDASTDGVSFTPLGSATRTTFGWQATGLSLPTNSTLRARGFLAAGQYNGSPAYLETSIGPPAIVTQPTDQLGNAGQSAVFGILAIGSPPLFYQWQENGTNLPGATNPSLTVSNLGWADSGSSFSVVVSNAFGAATSTPAILSMNLAVADSLNPGANYAVRSFAVQPDGRILMGGDFTTLASVPRAHLGRLNADGSLDTSFPSVADNTVFSVGIQEDQQIVVAGLFSSLAGQPRNGFGRLTPEGTLDTFDPGHGAEFHCWALAGDGAFLIADLIGNAPDVICEISRYYPDGAQDTNFVVTATSSTFTPYIASLLVQPDGQCVVGGLFSGLCGQSCLNLSLLEPNGMPDASFYPYADNMVEALALQPDGGILLGGDFTSVTGQPRNHLARLNTDGSLDWSFNPEADAQVSAFALQVNGKIIVGGDFSTINGEPRHYLARLNPDGTLDPTFNPAPDFYINTVAIQTDGAVLVGGSFSHIGGQARSSIARLSNPDPAMQTLALDGSAVTWLREGSSPEVWRTTFDLSTNGSTWTSLGAGTRVPGGWQTTNMAALTSLVCPAQLRARGFMPAGCGNAPGWFVETNLLIDPRPSLEVSDAAFGFHTNQFGFKVTTLPGRTLIIEASTNLVNWTATATNWVETGAIYFSDPGSAGYPMRFYRARLR
jgi:uncharacterized delta-60 repeat protein